MRDSLSLAQDICESFSIDDDSRSSDSSKLRSSSDSSVHHSPEKPPKTASRSMKSSPKFVSQSNSDEEGRKSSKASSRSLKPSGKYYFDSDSDEEYGNRKSTSAKCGCDYPDDVIIAEVIDEVHNDGPKKWCHLFEGACLTNAGQLGHSNLPECTLNYDTMTVTVLSM